MKFLSCSICHLSFPTFDGYKEHCHFNNEEHNSQATLFVNSRGQVYKHQQNAQKVPNLVNSEVQQVARITQPYYPIIPSPHSQANARKRTAPQATIMSNTQKCHKTLENALKGTKVLLINQNNKSAGRPLIKISKSLFTLNPQLLMRAKVMINPLILPKNVTSVKVNQLRTKIIGKSLQTSRNSLVPMSLSGQGSKKGPLIGTVHEGKNQARSSLVLIKGQKIEIKINFKKI